MGAVSNRRADQLRERLTDQRIVVAPGVTDALTARLAVSMGFDAVYVGGYVMGQVLGMTEPLMTATETVDFAKHIAESVDVPVIVDGNAGFGDLLHCRRNVAAFGRAGVAAVHVEDQLYPKRARYFEGHNYVVDRAHAVEKIRFAVRAAREDQDIVVIGRTDAREAQGGGYDEAVARCQAFLEEGAEVVMPYATCAPDADEAADVVRRVGGPTMYVASEGKTQHAQLSAPELEALGWRIVIFNLSALMTSVQAVGAMLEHLRDFGTSGMTLEEVARTRATVERLAKLPEMYDVERASGPAEVHRG
jgi:methylisocitrate lyase